jgi:folate-dependent phosphoribosylglycinamide formyltransferase PurN
MKVLGIFGDAPNQAALAQKLMAVHRIENMVLIRPNATRSRKSLRRIATAATVGLPFRFAWLDLQKHYKSEFSWPNIPRTIAASANDPVVFAEVERHCPDLVLVSGTDLLRSEIIATIAKTGRIMNLHTGISPYIKGGPNCTNWALFCKRTDLIGNTVMWLDTGIDTGNIITTERVPNLSFKSLSRLHLQVMEHAHDLYCRAYAQVTNGRLVPSVPQSAIGTGRLFLTRQWNGMAMLTALANFYAIKCFGNRQVRNDVRLVSLTE